MVNDSDNTSAPIRQEDFFAKIPKQVLYSPDLKHSDIRVYGTLSERAGRKRHSFPGYRRIAADLHMSTATVAGCIARLEKLGAIVVERDAGKVNAYWLPVMGVVETDTPPSRKSKRTVSKTDTPTVSETDTELDQGITRPTQLEIAPTGADYQSEMKDALIIACGWSHDDMSKSMWGQVEKYGKELREMGVEPEEVIRRAKVYRVNRSHQTLSPAALVKWWPDCAEPRVPLDKRRVTQAADRAEIERRLRE